MKLILASTSPYRKSLLEQAAWPFEAHAPKFDEAGLKSSSLTPKELCRKLALGKAQSLADDFPEFPIVGSDQLVSFKDEVLGKPGSPKKAQQQLQKLCGQSHELITAICVVFKDQQEFFTDITTLTLRTLTHNEIVRYVEVDQPIDCAGSYKIEKAGITLMEKIETEDPSAIVGLPMMALTQALISLGVGSPLTWKS